MMKNLVHQTTQAFYFSLGFYVLAMVLAFSQSMFFPIILSIALFVSMIWVVLVIREVMLSPHISKVGCLALILLVILGNVFGGIIYFFLLRAAVLGSTATKTK